MTSAERYARLKSNPERLAIARERDRRWRKANLEHVRALSRDAAKRWYYKNHERSKKMNCEQQARWRKRNADKLKLRAPKYAKKWYSKIKNNPVRVAGRNTLAISRFRAIKKFINDYKMLHGCADCGYKQHYAALHFDHVRGEKLFNICHSKSISAAALEMEKCEVRCANCHAVRHAMERTLK